MVATLSATCEMRSGNGLPTVSYSHSLAQIGMVLVESNQERLAMAIPEQVEHLPRRADFFQRLGLPIGRHSLLVQQCNKSMRVIKTVSVQLNTCPQYIGEDEAGGGGASGAWRTQHAPSRRTGAMIFAQIS